MKPAVVLVTQFEPSDGSGGEFKRLKDGFDLRSIDQNAAREVQPLYASKDGSILAIVAGVGAVQTATHITALGLDPRFDLTEALWLVSGIAGGEPTRCALGTPVLTDWCVDGDLAWEIDGRELPEGWPTGILPLGATAPYEIPAGPSGVFGERYECVQLPHTILQWAEATLTNLELFSTPDSRAETQRYSEDSHEELPLQILTGATLSAVRFWHGEKMNEWANQWVSLFTQGKGHFHTSNMEDSGTLFAIRYLSEIGRASADRILVLRTVSNYTRPPLGFPATSTLLGGDDEAYFPGYEPALENGYRAASTLIHRWLSSDRPIGSDA